VKCLQYRRVFIVCLLTEPLSDSCENTVLSAGPFGPALPSVDSAVESWDSSVLEQSAPSNNTSPECNEPLQQLSVAEVYKSGEYESSQCNLFPSSSPVVLKSMVSILNHTSVCNFSHLTCRPMGRDMFAYGIREQRKYLCLKNFDEICIQSQVR
jgi:hypothetical protein